MDIFYKDNSGEKSSTLKKLLQFFIPLILSVLIFAYLYKGEDWSEISGFIKEANMFWLLLPIFIGLLSHYLRAVRWKMLIKASGFDAKTSNVFFSVMVGYFANFLFPRAGEVARCGMLKKHENLSFSTMLGTVITERMFDLVVTALIILATICLQYSYFANTLDTIDLSDKLTNFAPILLGAVIVLSILVYIVYRQRAKSKIYDKSKEFLKKIGKGFASFKDVENKFLFILLSILIFVCYFLMLYVSFFAFEFTENLSIVAGLVVYVMGALGIIAPVQGGIGAWHYLTITALGFYFVPETEAKSFALATHTVQTIVVYVGFGLLSYILMEWMNRRKKMEEKTVND